MNPTRILTKTRNLWLNLVEFTKLASCSRNDILNRSYAKSAGERKTEVDILPDIDPPNPNPSESKKDLIKAEKKGILEKLKLKMFEGRTNFGTPFRRLIGSETPINKEEKKIPEPEAVRPLERKVPPMPTSREGVQVSVLGADTEIGQYVSLLLKQCPCIKKLRLYETVDSKCREYTRSVDKVVQDLHSIDTNCRVEAFRCSSCGLNRCLRNTDIVLILENDYINEDMPFEKRFCYQAPIVKQYADCIAAECPKAFVVVCASPIDCMVPLIAETMKETGWHDPRKILGSLAVPEMRASTLAAEALCLEPHYTRVPCVGGTEGDSLVPLFSKAVEFFDFATPNMLMMTEAVRQAGAAVARSDGDSLRTANLSEAHAVSGLVTKVAQALLCQSVPRVTGFVETDAAQVISPARFLAMEVLLNDKGVCKKFDLPPKMNQNELLLMDEALNHIIYNVKLAKSYYRAISQDECIRNRMGEQTFFGPMTSHYDRFDECAVHMI